MPETSLYGIRMVLKDLDDYRPEQRIHTTLRQELVRSKSEVLVANQLFQHKPSYYFEKARSAGTAQSADQTLRSRLSRRMVPIFATGKIGYWRSQGAAGDRGGAEASALCACAVVEFSRLNGKSLIGIGALRRRRFYGFEDCMARGLRLLALAGARVLWRVGAA
jgi:hypothetical protein